MVSKINGSIYRVTNKVNGKCYIGLTTNSVEKRWRQHICDSKANRFDFKFHNALRKYGEDEFNWEVLESNICDIEDLRKKEMYYIEMYDSFNNGYNTTLGGEEQRKRYQRH